MDLTPGTLVDVRWCMTDAGRVVPGGLGMVLGLDTSEDFVHKIKWYCVLMEHGIRFSNASDMTAHEDG